MKNVTLLVFQSQFSKTGNIRNVERTSWVSLVLVSMVLVLLLVVLVTVTPSISLRKVERTFSLTPLLFPSLELTRESGIGS